MGEEKRKGSEERSLAPCMLRKADQQSCSDRYFLENKRQVREWGPLGMMKLSGPLPTIPSKTKGIVCVLLQSSLTKPRILFVCFFPVESIFWSISQPSQCFLEVKNNLDSVSSKTTPPGGGVYFFYTWAGDESHQSRNLISLYERIKPKV